MIFSFSRGKVQTDCIALSGKDNAFLILVKEQKYGMDQMTLPKMSRRQLMLGAGVALLTPIPARAGLLSTLSVSSGPSRELMKRAMAALQQHRGSVQALDRIGVVDFSRPSRDPRFFLVDLASGRAQALLVAHGRGSDPAHKGWLERFSNVDGSEASCAGAFVTGGEYVGKHGRSRRLIGLDPSNNNAERRAIVIHAAAYVGEDVVARQGKLGRSQGCFAFSSSDIGSVMERLGPGRLIYADRPVA